VKYGKEKNQSYDLFDPGFSVMPYDPLVNADGSYFVAPSQSDKSRRDLVDQYGLYSEDLVPMDGLKLSAIPFRLIPQLHITVCRL